MEFFLYFSLTKWTVDVFEQQYMLEFKNELLFCIVLNIEQN